MSKINFSNQPEYVHVEKGENNGFYTVSSSGKESSYGSACFTEPIVVSDNDKESIGFSVDIEKKTEKLMSIGLAYHKRRTGLDSTPGSFGNSIGLILSGKGECHPKVLSEKKVYQNKDLKPIDMSKRITVNVFVKNVSKGTDQLTFKVNESKIELDLRKSEKAKRRYFPCVGMFCEEKGIPYFKVSKVAKKEEFPSETNNNGKGGNGNKEEGKSEKRPLSNDFTRRLKHSINFVESSEALEIRECMVDEDTPTSLEKLSEEMQVEYSKDFEAGKKWISQQLEKEPFKKIYGEVSLPNLIALNLYTRSNISTHLGEERYKVLMKLLTEGIAKISKITAKNEKETKTQSCYKGCYIEDIDQLKKDAKIGILEFVSMCNNKEKALDNIENSFIEVKFNTKNANVACLEQFNEYSNDEELVLSPGIIFTCDAIKVEVIDKKKRYMITLTEIDEPAKKDTAPSSKETKETHKDEQDEKKEDVEEDDEEVVVTSIMDLVKNIQESKKKRMGKSRFEFKALDKNEEIDLSPNEEVEILQNVDAWTWVKNMKGEDGYVPTTYIIEVDEQGNEIL